MSLLALALGAMSGVAGAHSPVDGAQPDLLPPVAPPAAAAATAPVATDAVTYEAFGRVFPDPQGCYVQGDAQPPEGTPISPWAKGNVCAVDYLGYTEVIAGARFLARQFPDMVEVIRLDDAYDDPSMQSAGFTRPLAFDDGNIRLFGRDKSPLYMFKVTNTGPTFSGEESIPEAERDHFAFSLSIHGLERAGLEGGARAMEDLVSWAACEDEERGAGVPACESDGPFPKAIVEGETTRDVPSAGQTLDETVLYFLLPNPDGGRAGEKRPAEFRDGDPNANFLPGASYSRGNAHGVDLNRDWPTVGYTDQTHQPWSEPETKAFGRALTDIRDETADGQFAAGIDLHGMLDASAFSYTLLGADQRDYRKNAVTVETSLRTYEDQTQRLTWSPYIGDSTGDGEQDRPAIIPVADEWGTIFDTLGYTITGGFGPWMDDSRIGLGGVGINNEMALSHLAPNTVYEPALIQTHIDGNKGLIYSQIAALLFEQEEPFEPGGEVAYVDAPELRLRHDGEDRPTNPGLPAQADIDVLVPCREDLQPQLPGSCEDGTMANDGAELTYEFDVLGPDDGFYNGGLGVISSAATGMVGSQVAVHAGVTLERLDGDEWVTEKTLQRTHTTLNDPEPGRWRIRFDAAPSVPRRVEINFDPVTAEADPGQLPYDVSSLDFYTELNEYAAEGRELTPVAAEAVAAGEALEAFDTVIVTNDLGRSEVLAEDLGLTEDEVADYFANLGTFAADGGNLVLTDAALHALTDLGLVEEGAVADLTGLAGFYAFDTGDALTYEDDETYPLTRGVNLPGAAERTRGNRQAVEPVTIGYSPSGASHAQMPFWGVDREAWEAACDKDEPTHCTTAATSAQGSLASVGEIGHGEGVVRIVGSLLPNPNPVDVPGSADHRFGLGSYAITWTAYQVFENLVDWRREGGTQPPDEDEAAATDLAYTGDRQVRGNTAELAATLTTEDDGQPVEGGSLTFTYDGEQYGATTDETGEASVEAPAHSGREATVTVEFVGDEHHEPASTEATLRRGQGNGSAAAQNSGTAVTAGVDSGNSGLTLLLALALVMLVGSALRRGTAGSV